jgi:thiamine kinase-like enzyme
MTKNLCIITIENDIVRKSFKKTPTGQNRFFKELFNYFHISQLDLDYCPNLINYNTEDFWFELENVGQSLDKIYFRKSKRHLNKIIKDLHQKFYEDTNYYHNDIRYKNVCLKNGKYYLIDFENSDFNFKDKNMDSILNETYISNFSVSRKKT